jgi:hypothetical protein
VALQVRNLEIRNRAHAPMANHTESNRGFVVFAGIFFGFPGPDWRADENSMKRTLRDGRKMLQFMQPESSFAHSRKHGLQSEKHLGLENYDTNLPD